MTRILAKLFCRNSRCEIQNKGPRLSIGQKICYGVGHVFNDLCANCWFSYLLIYMTKVVGLSDSNAGLILLVGQIADAIFTPFIGYGCDRTTFKYYGRRKLWHLIGSICVITSFPFIFNLCIKCEHVKSVLQVLYYGGFVIVFQFGWAATQISHLSLIPEIARKVSERVELNAIRSGLTFVCGIYVFGVTWLLLGTNSEESVTKSVAPQFMYLAFVVIGTGFVFSLIFHVGTKEPKQENCQRIAAPVKKQCLKTSTSSNSTNKETVDHVADSHGETSAVVAEDDSEGSDQSKLLSSSNIEEKCKTWKQWFKKPLFYKMALVYMCTRLTVNVFQTYFVLYLTDTLVFEKEAIAYFPLLVLISGVLSSFLVKILTKRIGAKLTFLVGCCLLIGSSVWYFMVNIESKKSVYLAAVLSGCGCSIMLVTSLAMTADLIGSHKSSGAFVYSAMSFTDKLSSGCVIAGIQALKPIPVAKAVFCESCATFLRYVQSIVPGVCALLALFCVGFLFPAEFIWRKKVLLKDVETQTTMSLDNLTQEPTETTANGDIPKIKIEDDDESEELDSATNGGQLDEKLKRLSWHSSTTSYIAWRLASPVLPSPERKQCRSRTGSACV